MKIRLLIYSILTIALSGCYSDFEPDLESNPVLCVNAIAKVGEKLDIFVSRTWRWSDDVNSSEDLYLKDADVTLYVNDEVVEVNIPCGEWTVEEPIYPVIKKILIGYRTEYIPKSGDKIRIVVKHKIYGDAIGETDVPYAPDIDNVIISSRINTRTTADLIVYTGSATLKILFTDPKDEVNYYLVSGGLELGPKYIIGTNAILRYDEDPIFTEYVTPLESVVSETYGYAMFSDRMISGKSYPLHIRVDDIMYAIFTNMGFESNEAYINLTLNTISESYYNHTLSAWESNEGINGMLGNLGLAGPIWISNNVSSGAGVISAIAPSTLKIPLARIVAE